MLKSRVTLQFRSDSGREYLYDDATGLIFAWSPARESVLAESLNGNAGAARVHLEADYGQDEVEASVAFVHRALEKYDAFVRAPGPAEPLKSPAPAEIAEYISNNCRQLVLNVTENCNLRCRYCVYSGSYLYHRRHTTRSMTRETAIQSIDWFVELVRPQITRNPRKMFGLSFYGGEPLLGFGVIKDVLSYVQGKYPGLFYSVITTNGTLLTPETAKTLVDHDAGIAVSLDGPPTEHDRRRVDPAGRGSYQRIIRNLNWLRREYPDYWRTKVYSSCVFDWHTDLKAVARFFAENESTIPFPIFVTPVGAANTNYYENAPGDARKRCQETIEELRQEYKAASINGETVNAYLNSSVGMAIMRILIRPRLYDHRPSFLPYTGTCVPGAKVSVGVDGVLDMCERTNGTYPIGNLAQGGINHARVAGLIGEYQEKVISRCGNCPVTRLCDLCFSSTEGDGGVGDPAPGCAAQRARAEQSLADYVSIVERNPTASFILKSDNVLLERRVLFFS